RMLALADGVTTLDISGLTRMDTAGAWFLLVLQQRALAGGAEPVIEGATPAQAQLIETVRNAMPPEQGDVPGGEPVRDRLAAFGQAISQGARTGVELVSFLGHVVANLAGLVIHPRRLRLTSVVHHCQEVGLNAVPIVALMAFLIGVVLAFQGAAP